MNTPIKIVMIAAVARNGVIGVDGGMPWHIPSDFAHFKRTTMGKPLVMGRKQFESVGRPLPGRTNIVVTRQAGYQPDGVLVINDFDAALEHAKSIARADMTDEIMIVGGGDIYRQGMALADKLVISHVDLELAGDVFFPPITATDWKVVKELPVTPDDRDAAGYSIKVYHRCSTAAH